MSERCIGGIEAVEFFQQFDDGSEKFTYAMNRIKYEIAKGIGKKVKHMPPPRPGYHETNTCGECGYVASAHHSYCPNCGTKHLRNPYTEQVIQEHQVSIEEWLSYGNP